MDPAALLDPLACLIVGGGTVVATLLRTPAREAVRGAGALRVLARRPFSADPLLAQLAAQARIAQRHGVLALDRSVLTDPDLAAGIALIVDGAPATEVERLLAERHAARAERHRTAAQMWAVAAEAAPAMGMVGTLVGLAQMFAHLDDGAAIGAAMGVALLATLYGALIANLILMPIASRLAAAGRIEAVERQRLDAPMIALARRETPKALSGHQLQSVA